MMQNYSKWISALVLALLLVMSGCGFQLRGHVDMPAVMERVYIQGNVSALLLRNLRQALSRAGSQVVNDIDKATAILKIDKEGQDKSVLSVNDTARAREYEVRYSVSFSVSTSTGEVILPQQTIELRRDYSFSEDLVLAKEREQASLVRDMQVEVVQAILRKILNEHKSSGKP